MPTDRDYAIATMLGENRGDTNQGLAAILDLIMNRKSDPSAYQAKSSSIKDIVTAGNGNQFNNWTPGEPNRGVSDRALQGIGSMSASEAKYYAQAAQVYDDYMAGKNGYQGITQGATFYQTPKSAENPNSFQNKYYGDNGDNLINVGRHQFTGQGGQFYKDQSAFYEKFPQYNPMATAGYDPSSPLNPGISTQGPGDYLGIGNGQIGNNGQTVETGNPYGFTGTNAAGDVGPGANNLGGATPIGPAPVGTAFGGKFDPSAYLAANQDVASDPYYGKNAFQHYLQFGLNEGRAVDAQGDKFDPSKYLSQNADVLQAGMDPLMHYAKFGAAEGRAAPIVGPDGTVQLAQNFAQGQTIGPQQASTIGPAGVFDAAAYLRNNQDVAADAGWAANPLEHFLQMGGQEGRVIDDNGDKFDAKTYAQQNPDVAASGMSPLLHFLTFGQAEGRQAPLIQPDGSVRMVSNLGLDAPTVHDRAAQLIQAQEVQRQGAPQAGLNIGAGPTAPTIGAGPAAPTVGAGPAVQAFDGASYLQANPDVAQGGYTPDTAIKHFLQFGQKEDRALTLDGLHFGAQAYLAANPDVAAAGMNPLQHYLEFGQKEGRAAELVGPGGQVQEVQNWLPANMLGPDAWAQAIGAPAATPTIGPTQAPTIAAPGLSPTIGAGPAVTAQSFDAQSYLNANPDVARSGMDPFSHYTLFGRNEGRQVPTLSNPFNFSNADVSQGAGPVANGSFGAGITPTSNLGMDVGIGVSNPYGFSGANMGTFGEHAAPAPAQQPLGQGLTFNNGGIQYGGVALPDSALFNPAASEVAYLDSQTDAANHGNAVLDAFNPAIRNGQFVNTSGTNFGAVSDYNIATGQINQANMAKPVATAPVSVPRVAQGAFAPAPFVGRW